MGRALWRPRSSVPARQVRIDDKRRGERGVARPAAARRSRRAGRGPGEAPPSVAFDDGSRRSRRSTTPATPAPTPVAAIIDPVRPAVAVSATIHRRERRECRPRQYFEPAWNRRHRGSWTSDERGGFARQGAFYLAGRACRRVPAYSQRNATIGSARIARRAGTQHANSTAAPRSGITPTNVNGSVGLV